MNVVSIANDRIAALPDDPRDVRGCVPNAPMPDRADVRLVCAEMKLGASMPIEETVNRAIIVLRNMTVSPC